jgi:hypothetical protein
MDEIYRVKCAINGFSSPALTNLMTHVKLNESIT